MLDKLKDNPIISLLIVCSLVIPATAGVTVWFYERHMNYIVSKCESDKAHIRNTYQTQIKKLELRVEQLKAKDTQKKSALPGEVTQDTEGEKSPAVISGGDVDIKYGDE